MGVISGFGALGAGGAVLPMKPSADNCIGW
jgi:hypothetical protein